MNARDSILSAIAKGTGARIDAAPYVFSKIESDLAELFATKAIAAVANIHRIANLDGAPDAIAALMAAQGAGPLHLHPRSPLNALAWDRAMISPEPPSGDQCAVSMADYGIAETGTLVFFSGPGSLSSWHFRPGREFALIARERIVPRLEDVLEIVKSLGGMPATLNLITGPSRTADIEQTIEMGAHGPRALDIVLVG